MKSIFPFLCENELFSREGAVFSGKSRQFTWNSWDPSLSERHRLVRMTGGVGESAAYYDSCWHQVFPDAALEIANNGGAMFIVGMLLYDCAAMINGRLCHPERSEGSRVSDTCRKTTNSFLKLKYRSAKRTQKEGTFNQ